MTTLALPVQPSTASAAPSHQANALFWVLLLAIVAGGVALRFAHLGVASLWFDEGYTAWAISLPPHQIIRAIQVDTAPPLFYLLLREWTAVLGRSEAALRSMSAFCSAAALLLCWLTARRLLKNRLATLMATALAAAAYMPVAYAHEARFYAMMLLLAAADFYLVLLAAERGTPARLTLLAIAWATSLYINNILALYVAASAAAWLVLPGAVPRRRRAMQLLLVGALAGLAFLPWVPSLLAQHRAIAGNFWASPPTPRDLADVTFSLSGLNPGAFPLFHEVAIVDAVFVLICLAALLRRQMRASQLALGFMAGAPVLLLFALSRASQPVFVDRVVIGSCAFTPILWAAPLCWLTRRWQRGAWLALLLMLLAGEGESLRGQWLGEHQENWRAASRFVQSQRAKIGGRSLVVFTANEGEMLYDFYARSSDYSQQADLIGTPADYFAPRGGGPPRTMRRVRSNADLDRLAAMVDSNRFDHVFLVDSHHFWSDPSYRTRGLLLDQMDLQSRHDFEGISVLEFERVR